MTFFIFLLACAAAASTGIIFKPGAWYESLVKPSFTPPNWLFPVAWTLIYLLLAWAGYRLSLIPGSQMVLALWAAQIALNTLWTPVFFGAHRLLAGMVIIVLLWGIVRPMLKKLMNPAETVDAYDEHALSQGLDLGDDDLGVSHFDEKSVGFAPDGTLMLPDLHGDEDLLRAVRALVANEPELSSLVVKNWLAEDE